MIHSPPDGGVVNHELPSIRNSEVKLSVIIVNFNSRELLRECLDSLLASAGGIDSEIFVVDNRSTDGSPEMVQNEYPRVRLIRNAENVGFAKANNQALRVCKGEYVLLLNNDTVILEDCIERMLEFMDAHPQAAMAGCRILNPDGSLQVSTYNFPSLARIFLRAYGIKNLIPRQAWARRLIARYSPRYVQAKIPWYWDHRQVRQVDIVKGAFCLVRSSAIAEVGLLDETTFMYWEETDWAYRMKKAGWEVYFVPDATIIHRGGNKDKDRAFSSFLLLEKNKGLLNFTRKHFSALSFRLVRAMVVTGTLIKFCLRLLFSPVLAWRGRIMEDLRTDLEIIKMACLLLPAVPEE